MADYCMCVCTCLHVCVSFAHMCKDRGVCVWERAQIQKNDSAGPVSEGWGLWLRSGSAGALLYKAMAYRRLHVTDGALVRSSFYISCLAVCSSIKLSNAKKKDKNNLPFSYRI